MSYPLGFEAWVPCIRRDLTRAILSYREALTVLVSAGSSRQVWGQTLFSEVLPTGKKGKVLGDQATALSDPMVTVCGRATSFLFRMTHEQVGESGYVTTELCRG